MELHYIKIVDFFSYIMIRFSKGLVRVDVDFFADQISTDFIKRSFIFIIFLILYNGKICFNT